MVGLYMAAYIYIYIHIRERRFLTRQHRINEACYSGVGSVPRGSVYGIYCLYCLMAGNIQPLNPASFGKLVRVIFPGLTTRRLGVRGESKYHYVNFCLRDQWARMELQLPALKSEVPASKKKRPRQGNEPSAVEPSTKKSRSVDGDRDRRPTGYGVYADRPTGNAVDFGASRLKVTVPLALLSRLPDVPQLKGIEERVLETFPDIAPYLPEGVTRQDSPASTLIALYTNHSLSLVKSLMMTKRKEFFKHYTSLSGTFTTPVQKLFYSPELAPWIQAVDLMAYQHMSRLLLWLSTQNMPKHAIDFFEAIGENLVSHIQTAFSAAPPHVLKARIVPAAIFAQITRRCLRVNAAALRIGDPLAMPAIRDAMYADFIRKVSVDSLVSIAVPEMAMDDLAKTLVSGLPAAIAPTAEFLERNDSVFNQFATNNSLPKELAETSLGPWVGLLLSLKTRFPYASATDVMNGLEMIATRFMEELTLDSPSFGTWWLVKCFVTEWFHMMCETGGLIEMASRAQDSAAAGATDDDAEGPSESSDEHSQHRAASPETADTPQMDASASFGLDVAAGQSGSRQQGQQAEDHAAFPATTNGYHVAGAASPSGNMHDDSGIGMMATPPADLKGQASGAENEPVGAYVGA